MLCTCTRLNLLECGETSLAGGRQEDIMSQHRPSQGTTTEGMSFPTRGKGKTNREAQHHTTYSLMFPFQRKAGLVQEETT